MLALLKARGFRNLEPLVWQPGVGRQLLLGDNGSGKTSLLEAVYVLSTTKSFRTSRIGDCARRGTESFHLEGEVEGERRTHLTSGWSRPDGRYRTVNGKTASRAEHLSVLPVVAWSSAEAELITGPPELRRRLLDRGVVGLRPATLEVLSRYRRALAHKRELLVRRAPRALVAPWNELMAAAAAEMSAARRRYVERLAEALEEVLEVAGLPYPAVSLTYRPSPRGGPEGRRAVFTELERAFERERAAGMALIGPHRDELEICWGGSAVRGIASSGERKALSLLLAAAHGRVLAAAGRVVVYLLDDMDAELSATTLRRVWEVFAGVGQLFASSNRPRAWEGLETDGGWQLEGGSARRL